MGSILNKIPDLDEREIKIIRKLTKSIVNQMLRDPILRIKEMSAERHADEALELFTKIFALEELVAEQKQTELQELQRVATHKLDKTDNEEHSAFALIQGQQILIGS